MILYKLNEIKTVEWEITNRCNASCPQCPRNNYGGRVVDSLTLTDVTLDQAKNMLPLKQMLNLDTVYFCGTYGDPAVNRDLIKICSWLKSNNIKIGIHTNGGIQKPDWWSELASVLTDEDFVVFSIDGLADTNHLYRIGVNWNKLITNVKSFIAAGGIAHWDYIVFKHNEHQVDEAEELSQTMGFSKFNFKKTSRFINKKHEVVDLWPVLDKKDNLLYHLELPENKKYLNHQISLYKNLVEQYGSFENYTMNTNITCFHNSVKKIYIGADGYVFPCGWLHDRIYGIEAEAHPDHTRLLKLFSLAGGKEKVNLNYNTLENIVNTDWFPVLEKSWSESTRLSRCGTQCGEHFNPVGAQNENVTYWNNNE